MKFIFEIRIKPGHTAEQYADVWVRVSRIIQRAPGARGTRLHRKIGDPNTLLAIASWDSKASRDAADGVIRPNAEMDAILAEGSRHADFAFLGEFEEPEWVVLPERQDE